MSYMDDVRNKIKYVKKDDIIQYLKETFDVTTIKRSASKQKVLDNALKFLTEENAINFIKRFNKDITYSSTEVKEILDITDCQLRKLVADGKIRIDATYKSSNGNIGKLYNIIDVWDCKSNTPYKKKFKIRELEITDENISNALYLINKSAKVSRDTKNKQPRTSVGKASRTRMISLYELKDAVISKLIKDGRIEIIGVHNKEYKSTETNYMYFDACSDKEISEEDTYYMEKYDYYYQYTIENVIKTQQLLFFRLQNNTFHIPYEGDCKEYPVLSGIIKEDISAVKSKNVGMTLVEAKKLLRKYLLMEEKIRVET